VIYRIVHHGTGVAVVSEDLRDALHEALAGQPDDEDTAVAIDALADAVERDDQLVVHIWAGALNVTITRAFPRQR
jgi:hypothetical protein